MLERSLLPCCLLLASPLVRADEQVGHREARGEQAMVVSEHPLATQVGIELLREGGNAVDAAVGTALALAVTYPVAGNLGGGGFLVYRSPEGESFSIDFRETAPAAATRAMFVGPDGKVDRARATVGHLAAGIPGSPAGLHAAHARFGKLPWARVIEPAVRLAREGFPVDPLLADGARQHAELFARFEASKALFLPGGQPLRVGELLRQPELAATLERMKERGPRGFYEGETADAIVAEMERGGGLVTHADLAGYEPVWREPLRGLYRGHEIVSMAPPSSGGPLLLQMLGVLERFDLGRQGHASAATVHLLAEVMQHAYADRAKHLGDPDFHDVPTEWLFSKERIREISMSIDPRRHQLVLHAGRPPHSESDETTHLSTVDGDGGAVSLTTTINTGYGCKVVVAGAGFLLNNEMDDFSAQPGSPNAYGLLGGEANAIVPGKRMLSSMTPTIVSRDGKVRLVVGTPGGSRIITSVLQVILNVVDHEMPLGEAVRAPRIHHQWRPDRIQHETFALSPDTRALLEGLGHELDAVRSFCSVQAILRVEDGWHGFSDLRRGGHAIGF